MVLEMVDSTEEDGVMKKVSGELTCRRMKSNAGLSHVREKLQEERVDECTWWQREATTGHWEGRLVVLCNFPYGASGSFNVYADYTPVGDKPRGALNWQYARRNFKRKLNASPAPTPAPILVSRAAAKAKPRPGPVRVNASVRRRNKDPFPSLQFRQWKGRLVAPIKPVLLAAKADTDHLDRRCTRWAANVTNGFADKAPRRGRKKGGKPEYVATEAVLRWIYEHE